MNIKVLGEGCDKCTQLYENTLAAVAQLGLDAQVEKVDGLIDIVKLGVMTTPSVMVDGKLIVSGQVASTKAIMKLLQKG